MATDRRSVLKALAAALLLGPGRPIAAARGQTLLSCRSDRRGRHFATLFDRLRSPALPSAAPRQSARA